MLHLAASSRAAPPPSSTAPPRGHRAALALALLCSACGRAELPPSALLVTLDTTRADALGCYGAPAGVTPHLDGLAASGVRFAAARTVTPITLPAHASILTGLYPPRHGIRDNEIWSLPDSARTLAEAAREAGYETAGFVAAAVLDRVFGLDQGFETWSQPDRSTLSAEHHAASLPAEELTRRFLAWYESRDPHRPFFCWVHFYDPHLPLRAPARFLRQAGGHPYLAEVARVDHAVGQLLAALEARGELDRTAVVVVGDHGEGNGDHGEGTHGNFVFDTTLRVPLIVRLPVGGSSGVGLPGARLGVDEGAVSVADVHPTLAGLLGLAPEQGLDGLDLFAPDRPPDRGVYFESYHGYLHSGWAPLAGWAQADVKYVHSSAPELYDPRADPAESVDRIGSAHPDELARYRARMAEVLARPALVSEQAAADRELVEQIRALGYVEAGRDDALPGPLEDTGLPSPHARVEELDRVSRATDLMRAGEVERALALYREVLEASPRNTTARAGVAYLLMEAGRFDGAAPEFEALLATAPETAGNHAALATCLERTGREETALLHYRRAAELDEGNVDVLRALASLLNRTGREDEAARWHARVQQLLGYADSASGVDEGN